MDVQRQQLRKIASTLLCLSFLITVHSKDSTNKFVCPVGDFISVGQGMKWGVSTELATPTNSSGCSTLASDCVVHERSGDFLEYLSKRCDGEWACEFEVPRVTLEDCGGKLSSYAFLLLECTVKSHDIEGSARNTGVFQSGTEAPVKTKTGSSTICSDCSRSAANSTEHPLVMLDSSSQAAEARQNESNSEQTTAQHTFISSQQISTELQKLNSTNSTESDHITITMTTTNTHNSSDWVQMELSTIVDTVPDPNIKGVTASGAISTDPRSEQTAPPTIGGVTTALPSIGGVATAPPTIGEATTAPPTIGGAATVPSTIDGVAAGPSTNGEVTGHTDQQVETTESENLQTNSHLMENINITVPMTTVAETDNSTLHSAKNGSLQIIAGSASLPAWVWIVCTTASCLLLLAAATTVALLYWRRRALLYKTAKAATDMERGRARERFEYSRFAESASR